MNNSDNVVTTVEICETFLSIQGESTYAGLTCFFIRLSGCNLSCDYCDTPQARGSGQPTEISELVSDCVGSKASISEITGGEPLLQPGFAPLAEAIHAVTCRPVLVETNGSCEISMVPADIIVIMDIKTPGSGMSDSTDLANINRLRPHDEVKFVLTDRTDYEWARDMVLSHSIPDLCNAVLFSAAYQRLDVAELAEWLTEDSLPVRLQVQLHRIIGAQ